MWGDSEQLPQQRVFNPVGTRGEPAPGLYRDKCSLPLCVLSSTWLCPSHSIPGYMDIRGMYGICGKP